MADTTTRIFTVDTGKAISNLKEYKEYLEDLKGTLLGLEKGTDEYNKTAEELRNAQQKLNEVMDIARGRAEGVEGSYDNLVAKMRDLKKEWRATADETERADLGAKILDINNKLKDLDASTGNFQRNVGDYKNAFSDAFDKMLGPLGKVGGSLGTLARDVKGMIPLIKTINSSAITGLKGIKAAIASTGIGLLVVAVGELAANWDAVADALDSVFGGTSKLVMDAEQLKNYFAEANYQLDLTIKKMEIMGATEWEINEFRLKQNSKRQEEIDKMVKTNNDLIENGTAAERKRAAASNEALGAEYDTLVVEHSRLIDNREIIKLKEKVADEAKKAKEEEQAAAEASRKGAQAAASWNKEMEALKTKATALGQTLEDSIKNPYEKLDDEYEKNLKTLDDALKNKQISDEQYVAWKEILDKNYAEAWQKTMQGAWKEFQDEQIKDVKTTSEKAIKEIKEKLKSDQATLKLKWRLEDSKEALKPENMGIIDSFKTLFSNDDINKWAEDQQQRINDLYDPQIVASENLINQYDKEIAKLKERGATQEEIEAVEAQKRQEELNHLTLKTEKEIESNELIDEKEQKLAERRQQRFQVIATGLQSVGNLMGNLASMMQSQIQQEVKDRKISEEQAKKKFKQVKALNMGNAVMNTAAGIVTAIATAQKLGPPMGPIVGAINAAAVAAAGAIQIATISKQKFDATGGGNTITTPNLATVTNEYKPEYVQNVQTQTELSELTNAMGQISPVVTVTDIEDGLQTNKVRVEENSF